MNRIIVPLCVSMALGACATVKIDHTAVPAQYVATATVPEFEGVRSWADSFSPSFQESVDLRLKQAERSGIARRPISLLSLSGGGSNGAFGAGFLNGWTERGNRPEFTVVSGISTGAIIAPLAFLGPDYDKPLRDFYTTVSTDDILRKQVIGGVIGGGAAIASSQPLADIIADVVTADFLEKIAQEHERGRRLVVITTNLEAQRPVIWDLGQIATYRSPEALQLFRDVVLASASIPGALPPVPVKVVAGGQTYTELHVDGGTTTNVFIAPVNVSAPAVRSGRTANVYVIQNGKLLPDYEPVKPTAFEISNAAISTMIKSQVNADVRRLQILAKRTGSRFQMVSIPTTFDEESKEPFDRAYMNALYDVGYAAGRDGTLWTRNPRIF